MEKTAFDARYQEYLAAIEDYLNGLFAEKPHWADLYEAMRYSVLSGGKRLRPVMTLEFARLCGLDWHKTVPVGCALELVHTYSLIHDDLPCMDDDDLRRGKPTNHKVYGETLAVLAGDALQPAAYRLILTAPGLTDAQRADCALILANASGPDGMVAGQVLDTLHHPSAQDELTEVHHLKTGAMIAGACMLGRRRSRRAARRPGRRQRPTVISWALPSRSGTICWTSSETPTNSASPSAPTRTRARSPMWTGWDWTIAASWSMS